MKTAYPLTTEHGTTHRRINPRKSVRLSRQQEEQLGLLTYALRDASKTASSIISTMDRIEHHLENSVRNMESANRVLLESETASGGVR
ncbi:MAG: hypothetical protein H7Y38_15075 [Armatimonadetes bacterium]|nr:hypothetical protein [Armatimonadota bacterium]